MLEAWTYPTRLMAVAWLHFSIAILLQTHKERVTLSSSLPTALSPPSLAVLGPDLLARDNHTSCF